MAGAFAAGLQSGGVLATAKHFPGHGDTQTDSHLDLPLVNVSKARMDSVELLPYRALFRRNLGAVMIAHLEVPAYEPRKIPSTLSPSIVDQLLKNQLGFAGLVVTDAMDMGALVNGFGSDSSAVRAVEAGVDVLLILPDEDKAVDALVRAVRSGRIPAARIDASVRKILGVKYDLGLAERRTVDPSEIPAHVATPPHLALAKEIARKAVTVVRNDSILPLERFGSKKILNVIVGDVENYRTEIHRSTSQWPNEPVGDYFTALLRKRYTQVETVHLDPLSNELSYEALLERGQSAGIILCPIFTRARSGSGAFGLPPELIGALDSLSALGKPVIYVAMGSPYVLGALPGGRAYVCAYSDCEPITEAAVEILFGETPAVGKLPVSIPSFAPYGTGVPLMQSVLRKDTPESVGLDRTALGQIDSIMTRAVRDSAFPGGVVTVVRNGVIAYARAFGHLEYSAGSPEANSATLYDIASLTKVFATTSSVMRLYDEGKIALDDPVSKYIPEFANHGKEKITLRNLLVHNGGLPPFKRLFLTCKSPKEALDSVYQTETVYAPGDSTLYSDFDFILLGKIVERVSGASLDRYADSVFFRPLGMTRTMYRPAKELWDNCAPTEYDSLYRKKLIRGIVHDENADVLGGVSGHAGLFSTAGDMAVLMQMLLNGGSYGNRRYLDPATVQMFTSRQDPKSSRALGWDTRSATGYTSAGSLMGERAFGHTGFTGTSVWADPDKKIFVILLTNRVYPTRNNSKIMQIRPAVADAAMRSLEKQR
jgi:CubicO group peptidase (beta-lactamase class C family)